MKIFIGLAFAAILVSLFGALRFIMKDKSTSNRAVYALAIRVGLSIVLFVSLLIAYRLGWITPSGIPMTVKS